MVWGSVALGLLSALPYCVWDVFVGGGSVPDVNGNAYFFRGDLEGAPLESMISGSPDSHKQSHTNGSSPQQPQSDICMVDMLSRICLGKLEP